MTSRTIRTLVAIGLAVALPGLAGAQAITGTIEGVVRDPNGAGLPGVTVALTNTATSYTSTVTTGSTGRFRGLLLPPGPYRVTASLDGFPTLVREGLDLAVSQTINLTLDLQLSTVEQEIVVTDEAPLIEVSRTESAVRLGSQAIEGLPNNGRNFLDLTKLTPGVTIVQGPDGDELSINGQKGINNNISVDGADFNNPFFGEQRGGQRPAFTFNLDAIEQVVVIPDGAPAEYGRSSGGFVNVITKSGTNTTRGSANLYYKDDGWASRAERPDGSLDEELDGSQLQAGFTLGGPVRTDEVFYFIAVDYQDADRTKQGDPNRIEPRVVDYFASIGSPMENGPITRTNDALVGLAKLDWLASDNQLATLRLTYTDSEQVNGTFDVDSWGRSANAIEQDDSRSLTGSLLSTLSGNRLNELRLQVARENRPRPYNGPIIPSTGRPLPDTAFDFGSAYRFGMPFFIPVEYYDERYQINDAFTAVREAHTWKAGIEYNDVVSSQTFIGFANGRYIFGSTDGFLNFAANPDYVECSDAGGNFVTGSQTGSCPAGTAVSGPVLLYLQQAGVGDYTVEESGTQKIRQKEPAIYFQDEWKPRPNLTVQYGLRWEALLNPDQRIPISEVFYAPFIGQTSNGQRFPSDGSIPDDTEMIQPRLGISWAPDSERNTVWRATAGIYHARVPALSLASTRSTNGSIGQTLFRNSALTPILGPVPAYPELIPQSSVGDPFLPDVFVFDEDFQTPRTFASSVSWESELIENWAFLAKFNYAKTDHITRFVNRNDPLLGSPWSTGLAPAGVNGIATLTSVESKARSRYYGLTLGVNKRLADNYEFQAYYTWSQDYSDDDNERDPFSFRYAKVTALDREWSYSDRDQRHRFNAWLLWRAPKGFDVNFRYSYRSDQPQSITATGAVASTPQDRCLSRTASGSCTADSAVVRRNRGRKDNTFNALDVRISRPFELENVTIEPMFEIFNLFNSSNFRRPEVTSLVFNFDGTVQSGSGEPRQFQIGARVRF